jgi:Concanavalin A-like lectin/glucanases superfamily
VIRYTGGQRLVVDNSSAGYNFTVDFTLMAFFRVTSLDVAFANMTLISKGNESWRIHRDGTTAKMAFSYGGGAVPITKASTSVNLTVGPLYHIACVYRPGIVARIYINGTSVGEADPPSGTVSKTSEVWIGGNADVGLGWEGDIGDVRQYDQSMGFIEINNIYRGLGSDLIYASLGSKWLSIGAPGESVTTVRNFGGVRNNAAQGASGAQPIYVETPLRASTAIKASRSRLAADLLIVRVPRIP